MERYRRTNPWGGLNNGMESAADGDWVKYEDAQRVVANLQSLKDYIYSCDNGVPCCNCRRIATDAANGMRVRGD